MAVFYLSSTSSASRLLKIIAQIKRKDKLQILILKYEFKITLSQYFRSNEGKGNPCK